MFGRFALALLFLLPAVLSADGIPVDLESNWPSTCLPAIPDVGPKNDTFAAITVLNKREVLSLMTPAALANPACYVPSGYYDLVDVVVHGAFANTDASADLAWEPGDVSGESWGYVWIKDPPAPSVPEPTYLSAIALALLLGLTWLNRRTRRLAVLVPRAHQQKTPRISSDSA